MTIFKHEYKLGGVGGERIGSCYVLYTDGGILVAVLNDLDQAQDLASRYIKTEKC
jgi:hypothetical protein